MSHSGIVYLSFDRVPAPKGAAVHIAAFTRSLAAAFGPLDLITIAPAPLSKENGAAVIEAWTPGDERFSGVKHYPLQPEGENMITRALGFRAQCGDWWAKHFRPGQKARAVHFRSIFEGYPIAVRKADVAEKIIYEVNGLPSIELKYHFPDVADDPELMRKLLAQEQACLDAADLIVTPSAVTGRCLEARSVPAAKIRVIPNGVDTALFPFRAPPPWPAEGPRLLYSGTLAAWQGVKVAVEALQLYRRDFPARLTLVGHGSVRQKKDLAGRVADLGLSAHVEIREPVTQHELGALYHEHDVSLAPLMPNDRNLVQGCCPLKVLESMAAGVPLIAADMPVVTDLAENGRHALLVRPGSAKAFKDGLLRLREDPALGERLATAAHARIEDHFLWTHAQEALVRAYRELLA